MIALVFFGLSVVSAASSVFSARLRAVIISYWVASLFFGAGVLTLGSEIFAVAIWFSATLLSIAFSFHALALGELNAVPASRSVKGALRGILPLLIGAGFSLLVIIGFRSLAEPTAEVAPSLVTLKQMSDLFGERYLAPLSVFAFSILLTWLGVSFLSRPDRSEE